MFRRFLRSSIQSALITGTCDQCDGSLTIDGDLLDAMGLFPYESILIFYTVTDALN